MNFFDELKSLLDNSYAPFSNFNVASIVVTADGRKFGGVNVESVAFPTTICAERNAIFSAVTDGIKPGDIKEVLCRFHQISCIWDTFLRSIYLSLAISLFKHLYI